MDENYDFEIVETTGKEAFLKVLDWRNEPPASEKYPFIIGGENSLRLLTEVYESNKNSANEIIEKSRAIDVEKLFEKLRGDSLPSEEETEFDIAELTGKWECRDSAREIGLDWDDFISTHRDVLTREFLDKCFVGTALTSESWQVPAFTRYGGWNACPQPEEHCAILRYWQEKYAAEIVGLTGDVIECAVKNPPQTEAECWQLAWQQFFYCSDIVDQGVGNVGELASGLRDSPYWYFWWD